VFFFISSGLAIGVYFTSAFVRSTFAVIDDHETRIIDSQERVSRLLEPAEFLSAKLAQAEESLETTRKELSATTALRDKYAKERDDWAEPQSKAMTQKNHIGGWVIVLGVTVEIPGQRTANEGEPYLEFTISVFNGALFQVILEKSPSGRILYGDVQLDGVVEVQFGPFITPGTVGTFRITQRLTKDDARRLQLDFNEAKRAARFRFEKLMISISDNAEQKTIRHGTLLFSRDHDICLGEAWHSSKAFQDKIEQLLLTGRL
jgi:hypothetical protein